MRAGLPGSVPSASLPAMVADAGFEVIDSQVVRHRVDPPLPDQARQVVVERIRRTRDQLDGRLDDDDRRALDVLGDEADPRGVLRRDDVFVAASRLVVVARPRPDHGDRIAESGGDQAVTHPG
jgi:hypothetical protein